jgi:hypothetical protein
VSSTALTEAPGERPPALNSPRDWWVEASKIFGCLLLPLGLLSTNITLRLPIPETMPLAFLAVGLAYVWFRRSIQIPSAAIVVVIVGAYGFAGILGYEPLDGLRVLTAAAVFLIAFQLCADRLLVSRACEVSIYVLTGFRALSIIAPAPMATLYEVLGLRSADLYGGGVAILFQEPSYLASAVLAMWAIAKSGRQESRLEFSTVDVCSVAILLLSGSVSAALYGVAGVAILVRNRWLPIAVFCLSLVAVAASFAAFENTRLGAFLNAASNLAEHSTIEDAVVAFSLLDPSASYRMSMGFVAVSAGLREPLGHLQLDMSRDTAYVESLDEYGVLSSNQLIDDFFGNLQANSVPLQMLYFGGIPLLVALMVVVCTALWRLWRSRKCDANYLLVIASIVSGCAIQSLMTSPFLYLAIAWGLGTNANRSHAGPRA